MQQEQEKVNDTKDNEKVIESASATTSPDNANSGPFAYIITGIVFGITLVLGLGAAGCASVALSLGVQQYDSSGHGSSLGHNFSYPYNMPEDLEDILKEYYPDMENTLSPESEHDNNASVVSLEDALNFDLSPYRDNIGDQVYASSYSGVTGEVRDFVRQVVNADGDYTSRLILILNDAALNENTRTQKMSEAVALCTEAQQGLEGIAMPEIGADQSGEVKDYLGTAKSEAVQRWQKMQAEMELLSKDSIATNALWNLDDDVVEITKQAASDLEQAMALSANR